MFDLNLKRVGGLQSQWKGWGSFLISALNHLERLLHIWSLGRWAGKDPVWLRQGNRVNDEKKVGRCELNRGGRNPRQRRVWKTVVRNEIKIKKKKQKDAGQGGRGLLQCPLPALLSWAILSATLGRGVGQDS